MNDRKKKMISVEIKVPDEMKPYVETYDEKQDLYRNALILFRPIRNLEISYGRAAELLGINKYDLIDLYEDMGIPYYDMSDAELDEELSTYEELKKHE